MWPVINAQNYSTFRIFIKTHIWDKYRTRKTNLIDPLLKPSITKRRTARAAFTATAICLITIFPTNSATHPQFHPNRHTCPASSFEQLYDMNNSVFRKMASSCALKKSMAEWSFSDPTLASLPLDSELNNYVRRSVPKVVFSQVKPTPLQQPRKLVAVSSKALQDILDMDPDEILSTS